MPAIAADLCLSSRWILPMTACGEVLENHTLVVRDGRILDVLPSATAAVRYTAALHLDRSDHLLLPGLVNSHTRLLADGASTLGTGRAADRALLGVAEMLKGGITCFGDLGAFPAESARIAAEQGMRVMIGIPIAEKPSPWAAGAAEYLTRALEFRDEYRGHPSITTAFAPQASPRISDATFARIATLANELDAGIVMSLHGNRAEIDESIRLHGVPPIERLRALGLLTPALTALDVTLMNADEIGLAQRSGIAVTLCAGSNLRAGQGAPPVAAWLGSGVRLGVGTGLEPSGWGLDLWSEIKLLALLARTPGTLDMMPSAWDALAAATRGGAAALGLDAEIGSLEAGKWADLCCIEFRAPALLRAAGGSESDTPDAPDLATALVCNGGRDAVSDVWVSGRHLLNGGALTRLDWSPLAARALRRPNSDPMGETT